MNREPVYHKTNPSYRIISVLSGKWQVQHKVSSDKGQNATTKSPHFDPWLSIRRPTTKADAANQMYTHCPMKG